MRLIKCKGLKRESHLVVQVCCASHTWSTPYTLNHLRPDYVLCTGQVKASGWFPSHLAHFLTQDSDLAKGGHLSTHCMQVLSVTIDINIHDTLLRNRTSKVCHFISCEEAEPVHLWCCLCHSRQDTNMG